MKVGEYIRTKYGIGKIIETRIFLEEFEIRVDSNIGKITNVSDNTHWNNREDIIKSSPVIIDLIKIGDYVNGMKITNKYIDEETGNIELEFNNGSSYLYPKSWNYEARSKKYKIKSIVTHEQFSQMEYRIGG